MKKLLAICALLSLVGCVNVMYHIPPEQVTKIYKPTSFVTRNCVGVWWNDTYKRTYPIEASWMKLTWFVWIVDLPCEVVMDTITLPYDAWRKSIYDSKQEEKNRKHSRFGAAPVAPQYQLNGNYELKIDNE